MDNSIDWTDYSVAWVSGDERGLINQIRRLKALYPDSVEILNEPEDNDGTIVAKLPRAWVKLRPPRQVSDEEKAKSAARLAEYRQNSQNRA